MNRLLVLFISLCLLGCLQTQNGQTSNVQVINNSSQNAVEKIPSQIQNSFSNDSVPLTNASNFSISAPSNQIINSSTPLPSISQANSSSFSKQPRIRSFTYQLQNVDPKALRNSNFDLVIIDYSKDGSDEERFTLSEISFMKSGSHPKLLLAYMSIGEAEDYRWYWRSSWDEDGDGMPDVNAPSWLGPSNPDWEGNYKVHYWDPQWKKIIFGTRESYLDKIIDAGFDGVYLDIIDAYEFWGDEENNEPVRPFARQDMIAFVREISNYAHITRSKPDFLIVPQNGEALGASLEYLDAVDGIGKEDTWYMDNDPNDQSITNEVLTNLDRFSLAGKFVLCTDYVTESHKIDDFYAKAVAKEYVPYSTVRELDTLTVNTGHEPQ